MQPCSSPSNASIREKPRDDLSPSLFRQRPLGRKGPAGAGGKGKRMKDSQTLPCGALAQPDGSVCWRVWAPRAGRVELVLHDGNHRRGVAMEKEAEGYFRHTER